MRILVLSDTHGRRARIDEVLSRQRGYDALLFLGDGLRDFDTEKTAGLVSVRGNCDTFSLFGASADAPSERMIDADGFKLLAMHGHEHGVKSGIERAVLYAYKRGADALLFGHTHLPLERYYPAGSELCGVVTDRAMYAFNPGSLGSPRAQEATFGVIEVRNGQMLFSHGRL